MGLVSTVKGGALGSRSKKVYWGRIRIEKFLSTTTTTTKGGGKGQ